LMNAKKVAATEPLNEKEGYTITHERKVLWGVSELPICVFVV